jgi:hypothetical protein
MIDLLPIILWALGGLFVLLIMEPDEGSSGIGLLILALTWPLATIWLAIQEFILLGDKD